MRAAIYVRVSTAGQEDNASLPTQEEACVAYCKEKGLDVVDTYREVHTGMELWERPLLTKLRDAIRHKKLDAVVVYSVDRLARDPVHIGVVMSETAYVGAAVHFVTEPIDATDTGMLIAYVRGYAAKIEHAKIIERTKRGLMRRAKDGLRMAGCKPKYGYVWSGARKGALEVQPDDAKVVERIYDLLTAGTSLQRIANVLTDDAVPSPKGKAIWRPTTIRALVAHPAYKGDGAPPLVDSEVWEQAQQQLTVNKASAARNIRKWHPDNALLRSGHIFCAYCGNQMQVHPVQRPHGTELRYRCATKRKGGSNCGGNQWLKVEDTDDAAWAWMLAECSELYALWCARQQRPNSRESDIAHLQTRIVEVKARRKRNIALMDDPDLAPDELADYKARQHDLRDQLDTLERDLAKLENWQETTRREAEQAKADLDSMTCPECDYAQKRRIMLQWGLRAEVTREGVTFRRTKGAGCDQ